MAEVFVAFTEPVAGTGGDTYLARACGTEMDDGRWQGWLEFDASDGSGTYRSPRETTQPNRTDLAYWATGLTAVYLEGALERTLRPTLVPPPAPPLTPAFDEPLPPSSVSAAPTEAVLNPYSVYRKGEPLLRRQLAALAPWHLVNIVRAYELSRVEPETLSRMSAGELIELIVVAVREDAPAKK